MITVEMGELDRLLREHSPAKRVDGGASTRGAGGTWQQLQFPLVQINR